MTTTPEALTRLIGPIPGTYSDEFGEPGDIFHHPGGPRPMWGGYWPIPLPQQVNDLLDRDFTSPFLEDIYFVGEEDPRPALVRVLWQAHTTGTLMVARPDGWYVGAPARPCRRAVHIAVDALRDGAPVPGGLLPEEIEQAQRIAREGGAHYRASLPWEPSESVEPVEVFRRRSDDDGEV